MRISLFAKAIVTLAILSTESLSHGVDDNYPFVPSLEIENETTEELSPDAASVVQGVISKYKVWEPGQTLKVCFFDGQSNARKYFVDVAGLWDEISSITFDFGVEPSFRQCGDEKSHIRVSLKSGTGNWSYVGTDSLVVPQSQVSLTVSVGDSFELLNKRKLAATIIHELGHALGLLHEHQSPKAKCEDEFNWEFVYSELGSPPNSWDRPKVDHNLRRNVSSPRLLTTEYDPMSIMHYFFPASWFTNGENSACYIRRNTDISRLDEASIKYIYPEVPQQQRKYFDDMDNLSAVVLEGLMLSDDQITAIRKQIEAAANRVEVRNYSADGMSVTMENISTNGPCSFVTGIITGSVNLDCSE